MHVTTHIDPATLEDLLELARLERAGWRDRLLELGATGLPLNAGDDDDDAGDGADDDDGEDDGDGDGTGDGKRDDDDGDDELTRARKALAATNRELRKLKAEQAKSSEKSKREAGQYRELYEEAKAELEKLKADVTTSARTRLAEAALTKLKAKNPAKAVKLLDLEDLEDAADAERAAKRLLKEEPYLFDTAPARQKRSDGGRDDDDDGNSKPNKRGVSRLRRGLEAPA